jgi:hypothetical protein
LFETVRATRGSSTNQQDEVQVGVAVNVETSQKPVVKVKNPPRTNNKGHPKEKVDRLKSIVMQSREKAMKNKARVRVQERKHEKCHHVLIAMKMVIMSRPVSTWPKQRRLGWR